jgi:AcrR family transcriptional regulator
MSNKKSDKTTDKATSKSDRRSRRSQQLLFRALLELILEKGYENVSITEITARADVARGTFYLHFKDKDELLLSSFDQLAETILEHVKHFSKHDLISGVPHPGIAIFEHVHQNPTLFRVILNGKGGTLMLQRLRLYVAHTTHQALENMNIIPAIPTDIVADFVAGAMLSVLGGWLEDGMRHSPQEMATMFYKLIRPSILSALSLA